MTAAAYRGIASRGCAASSLRITVKTLGTRDPRGNAQNVLIASFAGDANGGIQQVVSPIGVSTTSRGLASSGDFGARRDDLRYARLPRRRNAVLAAHPSSQRDTEASWNERAPDSAEALGGRASAGRRGDDRARGRVASRAGLPGDRGHRRRRSFERRDR